MFISIEPGQLIRADQHGFLAIPFGEEERLLEAAAFMDGNECDTLISAARNVQGLSASETLERLEQAANRFVGATRKFKER